jgi:hypothetical protein
MDADDFAIVVKEVEQNGIVFSYTDENNFRFNIKYYVKTRYKNLIR